VTTVHLTCSVCTVTTKVSPVVDADGGEVQLVLGPEDHVLGPDFQDGGRLQRSGNGEQRQLGGRLAPVILPLVLAM